MVPPFNNQVTLITGAGGSIGRELALQLARLGAVIAATDLTPEPLEATLAALKNQNSVGAWELADVTKPETLRDAGTALEKRLGPIEILIANAGIGLETSALNFRGADFEKQIQVNLTGVANSIAAVLPGMLERKRGHLVAISSLASYRGLPMMAGYCASKAGVSSLMDSLRLELRPRGIHCTTICPGWIRTPLTDTLPDPKPMMMEVDFAVRRMVKAIVRKEEYAAFPGQARWPLAFNRLLPTRLSDWMVKKLLPMWK